MSIVIAIQDYFWLVDRLELDDDPRNKVNSETQTVSLGKEMTNALKNGFLFSRLLQKMQSTYTKRTKRFFHFSQSMLDIKDNDSAGSRKANWGALVPELKHFAIDLDSAAL